MIEWALIILIVLFFTVAFYLLLSFQLIHVILGVTLLGNAVNLLIFTAGRLLREIPPIIPKSMQMPPTLTANPLPQALILTAIVISFSLFAFLLVLVMRSYQKSDMDASPEMSPGGVGALSLPPLEY